MNFVRTSGPESMWRTATVAIAHRSPRMTMTGVRLPTSPARRCPRCFPSPSPCWCRGPKTSRSSPIARTLTTSHSSCILSCPSSAGATSLPGPDSSPRQTRLLATKRPRPASRHWAPPGAPQPPALANEHGVPASHRLQRMDLPLHLLSKARQGDLAWRGSRCGAPNWQTPEAQAGARGGPLPRGRQEGISAPTR